MGGRRLGGAWAREQHFEERKSPLLVSSHQDGSGLSGEARGNSRKCFLLNMLGCLFSLISILFIFFFNPLFGQNKSCLMGVPSQ